MAVSGRAAIFRGVGHPFEIKEYPVPEPGPGAAVVRISLANVCGSDLHTMAGVISTLPSAAGRCLRIRATKARVALPPSARA